MNFTTLQLTFDDRVATLTLNRPEKRNAISFELIDDLLRALDEVAKSSASVLILTGAGKAFCSGMDLENLKSLIGRSPEQNLKDSETMVRLFRALYEFPEAKFGYTEVKIGFVPAIVSTFLLRQVGEKHARDLLLTGRIIGVEEAFRMGLINEVVPADPLMTRARELAAQIMENSPTSLVLTKRLLSEHARAELDQQIEAAVRENAAIRTTKNFREGVTSFLEKRKPHWSSE